MVDKSKLIKGAIGGVLLSAGILAKLADKGLSVAEVVLNGAVNFATSFANAPKLGIGKAMADSLHENVSKLSDKLLKKGREMF